MREGNSKSTREKYIPDQQHLKEVKHFEEKNIQDYLADEIYDQEIGQDVMESVGWWSNWWQPYDDTLDYEDDEEDWY
ncbi:MAG: hypothetical protein UMV23_04115 [Halanaerobium sp.]|nr:hypothetical protein [Halanaerobium sp.]